MHKKHDMLTESLETKFFQGLLHRNTINKATDIIYTTYYTTRPKSVIQQINLHSQQNI